MTDCTKSPFNLTPFYKGQKGDTGASTAEAIAAAAAAAESAQQAATVVQTLRSDLASSDKGAKLIGMRQPYAGAADITIADFASLFVDVQQFRSADPTGTTDSTDAFLRAMDTGRIVLFKGRYRIKGLQQVPGTHLKGVGYANSKLLLADGANSHMIYGTDITDCVFEDFYMYGNKDMQGIGAANPWRGIYLNGNAQRIHVNRVWLDYMRDHGLSLPYVGSSGGKDSHISYVIASYCGSKAHLDAGGPGGTGIGAGDITSSVAHCRAYFNQLNGFKSASGNYTDCVSEDNGGGFETGFVGANMRQFMKFTVCRAHRNKGSGFRHQGEGNWIEQIGCDSTDNDASGIDAFGNVLGLKVIGGNYARNGRSGNRVQTSQGLDGISLWGEASVGPNQVSISGATFFDDQATMTQEYGVYISDKTDNVEISNNNIFGTHKVSQYFLSVNSSPKNIRIGNFLGSPTSYRLKASVSTVGSATQDPVSFTVPASATLIGGVLRIRAAGRVSGTFGTKIIRVKVGTDTVIFSNQAAGSTSAWAVDATLMLGGNAARMLDVKSTTIQQLPINYSAGAPLFCSINVSPAGGDTITVDSFNVTIE